MELTMKDLKERLAKMEETYLLELLDIKSEDLVDRFGDTIEDRFDDLLSEIEEGFDPTDEEFQDE